MKSGTIFDIKEFAVHDGPGVRQTVFLKGCPLRCEWCHNPEGLEILPQLLVSSASCTGCGRCQAVCKHPEGCTVCGDCVSVCPLDLRRICGQRMTSMELTQLIRKDSNYYQSLEGGVTFSGGEPLLQGEFLLEVLEQLNPFGKRRGETVIHTAIETSGYSNSTLFRDIAQHLSLLMVDLKLMSPELHQKYIGVSNESILENIRFLCASKHPFVVRIPVIPGVNDNDENYRAAAAFLQGAKALQRVEFLPYHKTAGAKYKMLGRDYNPSFPTEKPVFINQSIFEEFGIHTLVL